MADLITEFNNLGGNTISEHQKKFSLYTKKLQALEKHERLHVLDNLQAVHRQEELFLTKLFLRFEHKDKITEIALSGDRILNKLIGNHTPFAFRDYDGNFFLNELFPNVSYIVRNKCINKLASTIDRDDVGETFFKLMLAKYGIKCSVPLLTVCSEAFIREIVTHFRIMFRERHLVKLHQRFGIAFMKFYYAEIAKYGKPDHFATQPYFGKYLSTKDIESFSYLLKYGLPKIGKRGFLYFLKAYKEKLITNPSKYTQIIRRKIIYSHLSKDEFKQYLINSLPAKAEKFDIFQIYPDLQLLPIGMRGTFLAEAFRKKYGYDIWTDEKVSITTYIKISLEDRLKFKINEDEMLEYYAPEKAFPLIKEKINLTSDINSRCQLVLKMFRCAKNHNDENVLLDALKYFSHRHKNDNTTIRQDIFTFLRDEYQTEKLSAEHWKYITEMILTEEIVNEWPFMMRDMLEELLHYKFVNKLDITADFKKFVKYIGPHYFVLPSKNKELRKWALLKLPEVCAEVFTEEEDIKKYPQAFLNMIHYWNRENPKEFVSYYKYPDLIDSVMKTYDGSYYNDILTHCFMTNTSADPEGRKKQDELLEQFERFVHYESLWRWLLRHRIDFIETHTDLIFHKNANPRRAFFYQLQYLHYTSIPRAVRAKALEILHDEKSETYAINKALTALSYEKDFLQIINIEQYYPTEDGIIDVREEKIRETVNIREHLLDCFKNVARSKEAIEPLLRFCIKDYFSRALSALTFTLFNCPERALNHPLSILQDRSVTVRKRALFFSTTLCNVQTTCDALKHAGETEKNQSLQKFIFNRSFKAFGNICNETTWELLMQHFAFVFEKDSETREMVFALTLIPRIYLGAYIDKIWNHIGKQWKNQHNRVLNRINPDILPLLSDSLCDDIIQFNLLHSMEGLVTSDVDFIYSYLMTGGEKIDHRFDVLSNNARVVADEHSQLDFKEFSKKSHNIWFLYNDICNRLIMDKETHIDEKKRLLNKLIEAFPNLPLPYNHLDYQLKIDICKCYLENETALPEFFIKLQKDVIGKYGDIMLDYFNEFAKEQLHIITNDCAYLLNFIQKLLDKDNSTLVKMMAVKFMPDSYPNNETQAQHFRKLIENIEADAAPAISLHLNKFLKSLTF